MDHLERGTVLLHKYRIDRFRLESAGVSVYDGTDTVHARGVSVKMLERGARLGRESRDKVVDIGRRGGSMYFVESSAPMRRVSKPPPPLPKAVDVPITFEEVVVEEEPTVIVELSEEPTREEPTREEPSREEVTSIVARSVPIVVRRRPRWIALLVAAVLVAGALVMLNLDTGKTEAVTTTNAVIPIESPKPPPPPDTAAESPKVTPPAPAPTTTSDTETTPRRSSKSKQDPLTI